MDIWRKENMKKLISLCCLISVMTLSGCTEIQKKGEICAIYLHEAGHYSVLGKEGLEVFTMDFGSTPPRIMLDIPKDGKNWYEVTYCVESQHYSNGILHIKSTDDITAAKWKKTDSDDNVKRGETIKLELGN